MANLLQDSIDFFREEIHDYYKDAVPFDNGKVYYNRLRAILDELERLQKLSIEKKD